VPVIRLVSRNSTDVEEGLTYGDLTWRIERTGVLLYYREAQQLGVPHRWSSSGFLDTGTLEAFDTSGKIWLGRE